MNLSLLIEIAEYLPNCHHYRLNHISRMYLKLRRRQSRKYRQIIAVMLINEVADISIVIVDITGPNH